jgi:small subunit ribosomal protein S9
LAEKSSGPSKTRPVQTVGRRKEAVARVTLRPGSGEWDINGREASAYFVILRHRQTIEAPLKATDSDGIYDILVRVRGGGLTGQADAVQLALARALVDVDEEFRPALRARGYLTRDARVVERKKPGRPKARKRFQFSKR